MLVGLAMAVIVASLLLAARPARRIRAISPPGRGLLYAGALLAVFCAQELVEGLVAAGHPAGLSSLLAAGGWIAAPLALALGLVAGLAERLLDRAEASIAAAAEPASRRLSPAPETCASGNAPELRLPASSPLAFGLARRPPPAHAGS